MMKLNRMRSWRAGEGLNAYGSLRRSAYKQTFCTGFGITFCEWRSHRHHNATRFLCYPMLLLPELKNGLESIFECNECMG